MEPEGQQSNDATDTLPVDSREDTAVEVNAQSSPTATTGDSTAPLSLAVPTKKSGKKVGLIAGIAIAVLALAGSASAYQFWYQSPDKIMADAISHLMATKQARITGDAVIDSDEVRVAVEFKSNGDEQNSSVAADVTITPKTEETKFLGDIKLGADAIVASNGDLYFKLRDIRPVVDKVVDAGIQMQVDAYQDQGSEMSQEEIDSIRAEVSKSVDPIVSKIDNKWIRATADDLEQEGDDEQACFIDAVEKINNDDAMQQQLVDTYKKHKFILVDKELGVKDGLVGYQLKVDDAAAEAFGKAVQDTNFGSELKKCDEDFFNETSDTVLPDAGDEEVTTEIWITQWSHQLRALKVNVVDKEEKMNALLDLDFTMGVSDEVVIPSDATSITELQADITELMSGTAETTSLSI